MSFDSVVIEISNLTQAQIVAEAKRAHAQVMNTPPQPTIFKRHVDGVEAPEEAVKPGGIIVYDYLRLDTIKDLALETLKELSPVKSGKYRDAHRVIMDTPTEVRITNTIEYARVIELAARGKTTLRIQKGGHVYDKAARILKRIPEVADSVTVDFTFTDSAGPAADESKAARRAAQWPTLIIKARH
ncbi:hypothetical protein [Bradyrhizobium australafricanum]|uniref:hypothetical protein n=1 Tax=Bradyrhizobium australafricanum TaxID=2821406 RepID=UPI001CE30192|nr:hypothetical protein [Bradyrhizobium australafricanum]MCA6105349.1 hypothetical protein [Bradyrhizobium australafricanum]